MCEPAAGPRRIQSAKVYVYNLDELTRYELFFQQRDVIKTKEEKEN